MDRADWPSGCSPLSWLSSAVDQNKLSSENLLRSYLLRKDAAKLRFHAETTLIDLKAYE